MTCPSRATTAEGFLDWFRGVELVNEPGTAWVYANPGFTLLAMVIETVNGGPFERFVREEVLAPAGVVGTGYVLPDWSGRDVAVGYRGASGGAPRSINAGSTTGLAGTCAVTAASCRPQATCTGG
jgi:CubicO group peptidase (beta-lactamase class C family)